MAAAVPHAMTSSNPPSTTSWNAIGRWSTFHPSERAMSMSDLAVTDLRMLSLFG